MKSAPKVALLASQLYFAYSVKINIFLAMMIFAIFLVLPDTLNMLPPKNASSVLTTAIYVIVQGPVSTAM